MTGYIQRLLDRTSSLMMADADAVSPQVRAVGRLTAPLLQQDQRLMTGEESVSDIEGYLEREGDEVITNDRLFDLPEPVKPLKKRVNTHTVKPIDRSNTRIEMARDNHAFRRAQEQGTNRTSPLDNKIEHPKAEPVLEKFLPAIPSPVDQFFREGEQVDAPVEERNNEPRKPEVLTRIIEARPALERDQDRVAADEMMLFDKKAQPEITELREHKSNRIARPTDTKLKLVETYDFPNTEQIRDIKNNPEQTDEPITASPAVHLTKTEISYENTTREIAQPSPVQAEKKPQERLEKPKSEFIESVQSPPIENRPAYRTAEAMSVIGPLPVRRRTRTIRGLRRR